MTFQILSHRGYHVDVPENTLDAFDRAVALGVDGIETDVRLTVDGEAILFHDRLAPNGQAVASITRDELSRVVGYVVPTLEAAIERHPQTLWNLEIKTPEAADATLAAVHRFSPVTRFLISSFWHPVIARLGKITSVPRGLLIAHCPVDLASLLEDAPGVNALIWYYETVDADLIKASVSLGLQNLVYGPVSMAEHQRLLTLGVDGIISDRPDVLIGHSLGTTA